VPAFWDLMIMGISSSPPKFVEPQRRNGTISMRTAMENYDERLRPETV
jgi:hypothetical protein